jgi:hypothetical protein
VGGARCRSSAARRRIEKGDSMVIDIIFEPFGDIGYIIHVTNSLNLFPLFVWYLCGLC